MKLVLSNTDTADIVRVSGRIDATTSGELDATVHGLVDNGRGPVVLDFAEVDYISSAGLRVLLIALRALSAKGRKLALAALNPDVMDVVRLTGFDRLLNCYGDVDGALEKVGS
jgi:anti-anti-sigma factor